MIATFFSLQATRIGGLALGYASIVLLSRAAGPAAVGEYLFLLNSVIVIGTLASLGIPTLVQRLGAELDGDRIGAGTRLALRRRWPVIIVISAIGVMALLALDREHPLTLTGVAELAASAAAFSLTLVLVETLRISHGPRLSEAQRNLIRPALIIILLIAGMNAATAVTLGVLGALLLSLWQARKVMRQDPEGDEGLEAYVAERGRDLFTVFVLGALVLVFGAMDIVFFGLLEDEAETGIYGAASRYGMLVNVALLAGNAQMVRHLARVASTDDTESWQQLRRQIRVVRLSSTGLLLTLIVAFPIYAWVLNMPATRLFPYFVIVAVSFWLQGVIGPVNMFLMQAHEAGRLIGYHLCGLVIFGLVASVLFVHPTTFALPLGIAAGANTVKILAWLRIRRSRGLRI